MLFVAFTTYVGSLLEYNSPVWSPRYVYLKDKLESVQRRVTKRLNGFGRISYAARLDRLKAETLELCRLKSNLNLNRGNRSVDTDNRSNRNFDDP